MTAILPDSLKGGPAEVAALLNSLFQRDGGVSILPFHYLIATKDLKVHQIPYTFGILCAFWDRPGSAL
jgi:hypothetical protein